MKNLHGIILYLLICSYCNAQSFSEIINLGIDKYNNLVMDVCLLEDSLLLATRHICPNQMQCTAVSSYDLNNKISKVHHMFEARKIGNNHGLLSESHRKIISFHNDTGAFNGFFVQTLTNNFDSISFTSFLTDQDTMSHINDGILKHKGDYYAWGEGANDAIRELNGHIVKLDSTLTRVKDAWYFHRGTKRSHLNDLQVHPDGNMTFLVTSSGSSGNNPERTDSLHLIKIDTSGDIINEISIAKGYNFAFNRNFYTLRNGNYVIMNFRESVYGSVQCLDHETGEVVWSWDFPEGKFNEFNRYSVSDYVETSNGDIVICGFGQEALDGIWDSSRWTAIAAKLSPEGELVWFRRFLVPNETNPQEKGPYHFDLLKRVFERKDNTLCFIGESIQVNLIPPYMQYAWILALDGDDCYKGNCSDTIVIDKQLTNKPKIELGAKWTYERANRLTGILDFVVYEVIDTLMIDTLSCYIVEQDRSGQTITLCVDGNRMLTPDEELPDGFQLLYDFDVERTFTIDCESESNIIESQIEVDSIVTTTIADGQLITTRYLKGECHYGFGVPNLRTYDGIGAAEGGLFRCIEFCDKVADPVDFEIGELRCFENSTESFRFVDYACDSILIRTSTQDIREKPFVLFPNPAKDVVFIEDAAHNLAYRLVSSNGQVVSQGVYTSSGISLPYPGLFYISIITDDGEWTESVIRY